MNSIRAQNATNKMNSIRAQNATNKMNSIRAQNATNKSNSIRAQNATSKINSIRHICFEQEMQILPIFANTDSELVRGYNVEAVYRFTIQRNISQQQRHVLVFIPSW